VKRFAQPQGGAKHDNIQGVYAMKKLRIAILFWGAGLVAATPAWGVSKEILQLQTQMQLMQDQMTSMQRSFDERMGVMRNLVEQSTDTMNKIAGSIDKLQTSIQKQTTDGASRVDQFSGQIQSLNDSIDELKARLGKVSKQLDDLQASQQTLAAQTAATAQVAVAAQQAPPPDVLYNNGLRDYTSGKADLATQEFSDYLKFYPNTDLAGNASFYLAEIEFKAGSYAQAAKDYDKVLENFPSGNKVAAAHLKKGYSFAELGQKDAAVAELQTLIQRFPRAPEAAQAKEKLLQLGVSTAPARKPR
jgi:tol-pal system protein YbgF